MNQMAEAFASAGYRPQERPEERLRRMMREAIIAGGGRADPARDHFIVALVNANDAALLWELFAPVRAAMIGQLFREVVTEMRAKAQRDAEGEASAAVPQGQRSGASPSAPEAEGRANTSLPQGQPVSADPSARDAGAEAIEQMPQGQRMIVSAPAPRLQQPSRVNLAARENIARLSILQTFRKIGGAPLAEVTGAEARAWLKTHERDGRFVRLIVDQVPDELRIGAIIPPDEADRLYRLATDADNG